MGTGRAWSATSTACTVRPTCAARGTQGGASQGQSRAHAIACWGDGAGCACGLEFSALGGTGVELTRRMARSVVCSWGELGCETCSWAAGSWPCCCRTARLLCSCCSVVLSRSETSSSGAQRDIRLDEAASDVQYSDEPTGTLRSPMPVNKRPLSYLLQRMLVPEGHLGSESPIFRVLPSLIPGIAHLHCARPYKGL